MPLPKDNRLQLGVNKELVKEFLVIKERVAELERSQKGFFSKIQFNNEVIAAGLAAVKKRHRLNMTKEKMDLYFKRIRRKYKKKGD